MTHKDHHLPELSRFFDGQFLTTQDPGPLETIECVDPEGKAWIVIVNAAGDLQFIAPKESVKKLLASESYAQAKERMSIARST